MDHPAHNLKPTSRIGRFFYAEEIPYGAALVRMALPLVLLITMFQRWTWIREIYSTDGATAQLSIGYGIGNMLPEFAGGVAVALVTALMFFLVTSSIGWFTRFSLIASTIIYTYIGLLDIMSTLTKYTVIASHVLLLLSLSNCGAIWSVDSLLKRKKRKAAGLPALTQTELCSPVWPQRLIQLLIGFVYFGAALTKIHTPEFFSGEQLMYWMLTHVNFEHPVGEFLTLYPAGLTLMAYITVVWEILFIFLCWKGWGRVCMIGIGAAFHIGSVLTLGLYIFPLVCFSAYLIFIQQQDVVAFSKWMRRHRRSGSWIGAEAKPKAESGKDLAVFSAFGFPLSALRCPGPVVFGLLVLLVACAAVEAEYQMDRYGVRRPEGPYALRELDPETVSKLIGPSERLRTVDKIHTFETGTMLMSGVLANRRREFKQGEIVIAQCTLTPPHGDMWLQCDLHDSQDRVMDRTGSVVPRELSRCNFTYRLDRTLDPGEYHLVLKSGSKEIMRRTFILRAGPRAAVGN